MTAMPFYAMQHLPGLSTKCRCYDVPYLSIPAQSLVCLIIPTKNLCLIIPTQNLSLTYLRPSNYYPIPM